MKKLLKKRIFIPLAVVAVMAISATVAYAWWTANAAQTGNSVTTATASLALGGGSMNLSGLEPQFAPAPDAADGVYGAVSYVYVQNTGSKPLMFYVYLADPAGDVGLVSQVHVRIWLQGATTSPPAEWTGYPSGWADTFQVPGPWLSYDGMLGTIWNSSAAGKQYLASVTPSNVPTPIGAGEYGVYRIAVWLDSGALNDTQGKSAGFSINVAGKTLTDYMSQGWTGI